MTASVPPATVEAFRISPQQRWVWMRQGVPSPQRAQCVIRIEGGLQADALAQALDRVVQRHESLRTFFPHMTGMAVPVQVISDQRPVWREADISDLNPDAQAAAVQSLLHSEIEASINLESGVLVRACLTRLSRHEHLLGLTLPALCADRWSLRNVASELARFYTGAAGSDDEPVVQYLQFSEWQNEVLESEDEDAQAGRAYWRNATANPPPTGMLPFEKDPIVGGLCMLDRVSVALDPDALSAVRIWCSREEVLPAAFHAACWHSLLALHTGQAQSVFSYGVDGRKFEELHDSVGLFSSYVPVSAGFSAVETYRQIVERMNGLLQEAIGWQEYFTDEQVPPTGGSAQAPGFAFWYEDLREPDGLAEQGFSVVSVAHQAEPFKLSLLCANEPAGLSLEMQYDSSRYAEGDIRRLAECYEALLTSALQRPDAPIASLNLLPHAQRQQVLFDWNQTDRSYPPIAGVHQLFEQAAHRTPDAPALVFEQQQLCCQELNQRANQLAHYLRGLGVGPNVRVGLCLERSLNMIVGLLGILKAGGAYVPLDPALPSERLAFMHQDSGAQVLVTEQAQASCVPGIGQVVLLDRDWTEIQNQSQEDPLSQTQGEHLVYVIYTSGSTGKPKGVGIEHRQLVNYVQGISERVGLGAGASYASVSTIAADLGNTAVYGALCTGGCLHVISRERSMDSKGWQDYFRTHEIDCVKIVPSHLRALLGREGQAGLPGKVLVLGGESCSWELVEQVRALAPGVRVLNHYGPTETTVGVLTYEVQAGVGAHEVGSRSVPLGKPLGNSRVYVVSEQGEPVPIGVVGELWIGGKGVGRGYLNQEGLTRERFVEDRYSGREGERVYRSGDRCRYLGDGNVEFVGRVDDQVKVRGYRIELAEIESVLEEQAGVEAAVVVVREDTAGEKHLVGYVVGEAGSLDLAGLKEGVKRKLPEYMVPGVLVRLKELPLTANGKVDRKGLPAPEEVEARQEYEGPRNAVEEVLCGIWEEVLRRERVSVRESFFEMGGHSLLATQVISRVRETFQVDVPLRALFEASTVQSLALRIQELQRTGAGLQIPPLRPVDRSEPLPLSFSQQRLWFIDQLEPGSFLYNVPRVLRLRGQLDCGVLQRALEEIMRRHEVLRTNYVAQGGEPRQVICSDPTFVLPVVDLSDLELASREAEAKRLCREEATRPFDLRVDPMMRGQVVRLGEEEHLLLLTLHHIASDGWSGGILMGELSRLYQAYRQAEASPLPQLGIQYGDYAAWQRAWLQGEVLEREVGYWRERLSGAPRVLELPTDRPRREARGYEGGTERFEMGRDLREQVERVCREERATLFMVLLAAFKVQLYRWTGVRDLVVGTDVANRTQGETEGLIGFFLNHLVLRTDLSGEPSYREVVRRVREVCLGAYGHQELPFDKLVEAVQPERSSSQSPVFQVLFVLHNVPAEERRLSGLEVEAVGSEILASKYDLALFLAEREDGLVGRWVYRRELFEAGTIRRLSREYVELLGVLVGQPDMPIEDVEVGSESMRVRECTDEVQSARRRTAAVISGGAPAA